MESIGEQIVYDIQSSAHNFVCDGFAVHNCQQQNDPRGGSQPRFEPKMYDAAQIMAARIPRNGEVFICWRPRYSGHRRSAKYSEGAAARIFDGRVYIIDAWQGTYTPSGEAEKIVAVMKAHEADGLMIVGVPGADYVMHHVRNEALRRNRSIKMQMLDAEADESRRTASMEQLEPMIKAGRLLFSTNIGKAYECRKQFVNFGLVEENGIIECIAKFAELVPVSLMRANMTQEELEWGRRRRDDALLSQFLDQQGMNSADEHLRRNTEAHLAAMQRTMNFSLPPLPGNLDG